MSGAAVDVESVPAGVVTETLADGHAAACARVTAIGERVAVVQLLALPAAWARWIGVIGSSVLYAALCVATLVQALAGRPFLGAWR